MLNYALGTLSLFKYILPEHSSSNEKPFFFLLSVEIQFSKSNYILNMSYVAPVSKDMQTRQKRS